MRKVVLSTSLISFLLQGLAPLAQANRAADPDMPLSHCYHWLNERSAKYLVFKYQHASKNNGELTFYTTAATSNGAVAGPGLYCAKTPIGSYSYGDRVIRIDFVDDVVMENGGSKTCGTNGRFYSSAAECAQKASDVNLYNTSSDWYLIKSPQAIKSWSATSDQLIQDLQAAKADDPGAVAHLDMTIQAMQAEAIRIGKKVIFNAQARLGLEQILKDPAQMKKIPILSLIDMMAAYSGNKISDQQKQDLYVTNFDKALKDKLLSFEDFKNTLKNHRFLQNILTDRINKVNFGQLDLYNTSTLIAAIDNLNINVSDAQAQDLWQNALTSTSSLETILTAGLKKDGVFKKKFDSSLPSAANLATTVKDHNLAFLMRVLNDFTDSKSNLKNYTEVLFDKILKSTASLNFTEIYDGIKNPALDKQVALANLLNRSAKTKFAGLDPIGTSLLFEKIRGQFSSQEQQTIEADILNLPIKVDNKLSYQLLEDYKYGKLVLPSFYKESVFLTQLVDRSIKERSLGTNTTNTFRMILSGYYFFFTKAVNDAKDDDTKKMAAFKRATEFFTSLSEHLIKRQQNQYVYIALQNALFFASHMDVKDHPVEAALNWLSQGHSKLTQITEQAIKTSLDPSVLMYLSKVENQQRNADSLNARKLMGLILSYVSSAEFKQQLKSPDFIAAQAERKAWANVITNKAYSENGRVYSDICNFFNAYDKLKNNLLKVHSDINGSSIEAAKALAINGFCKKPQVPPVAP